MIGEVRSFLNQQGKTIEEFPLKPQTIAALIQLIEEGKMATSTAAQKLFPEMLEQPAVSPLKLAESLNLIQDAGDDEIITLINEVIKQHPNETERYKDGEKQLTGFFMGQLMKVSKGKADPKKANKLMREILDQK